ncbi:unnamed protein product [Mytilus coruscus]|uniref:TRIM56 n=1 Tax=Mytilus coruscus TaxID=42192 RepID=A0A6J8E1C9_MYTCO|nr:unnamed protein product [Mytilus coruscus]
MATSLEVKDELSELLTCPICLETFHVPKYLPCLHSFCQSCISTYIISSVTKEKDKSGFKCPVCRKLISFKENIGVPETWAEQLPKNHLIKSMMDLKDITRSEKVCNACQLSGVSKKAVSWCTVCGEAYCTDCADYHKKFRMSLNHKIISVEELKSSEGGVGKSVIVYCDEHPDKAIEIFCDDHSKPCCTLCATIYHRKCDSVTTIDKATSGIKTATKTTELYQKLQRCSHEIDSSLQINGDNKIAIETESKNIISEIDRLKSNIIKHLTRMENEIKFELSTKKGEILKAIDNEAVELTSLKCTIDNWKRIMNTCLAHGSELQCLTEVNRLVPKGDEMENRIKDTMSKLKSKSLIFKPIDSLKNFENNENAFGSLTISGSMVHMPSVYMQTGKIEIVHVFDVANGQSQNSFGSGIFLCNFILLTNKPSYSVVKFNREFVYQSELKLPYGPFDITKIDDSKVAVGAKPQIIIIDVKNMQIEKTLTINVTFWGLTYVHPEYIVAHSKTLTWIDASNGSNKKDFKTAGSSNYLHASRQNEFLCAYNINTVSKYVDENAKFTYTTDQLMHPRGIDVDYEGNIYICGYGSKNIHQLTKDGTLVRTIPASTFGISSPWIIRFEFNSNRFLLTDFDSGKIVVCKIC